MAEKISEYKTEKLKLMRETQPRTFGFTKGLLSALNSTVTNSIQEVTEKKRHLYFISNFKKG